MRAADPSEPAPDAVHPPRSSRRTYVGLAALVALLVAPLAWWMERDQRDDQRRAMAALAQVHAAQLTAAHDRLAGDARLLATAYPLARAYEFWRQRGDLTARDLLVDRLAALVPDTEFDALALLDATGNALWASDGGVLPDASARLARAWPDGAPPGATADLGLLADTGGRVRVAYATALPTADDVAPPIIVGQASVARLLAGDRSSWRPSAPEVRFALLDPLASGLAIVAPAAAPTATAPEASVLAVDPAVADDDLLGLAFASDARLPATLEGRGPDGTPAVGALAPVGTTGWRLLAFASARDLMWTRWPSAAVTLLLIALLYALGLVGVRWLDDQRQRAASAASQRAAADRDRARSLLAAIADASPDAIFAKDLDGRYLFVNRAAASFLAREPEAILGRDDRALFPPAQAEAIMAQDRRLVAERSVATVEEHLDTVRGATTFQATKGPLLAGDGQVSGTFGVSRDVTEREAASRALADQARVLRQTLEEVERFNQTLVDRELTMIDLKRRINALSRRLGEAPPFDLSAFGAGTGDHDG